METMNRVVWSGVMQHIDNGMKLTLISENVNNEQFVHGSDKKGPFKALIHKNADGEEWFHAPGMKAIYMRNFH